MLIDNVKTGDRVEIRQKKDPDNARALISQVEDRLEKNKIVMHVPISYGKAVGLTIGAEYKFMIFTDKGILRFGGIVEKNIQEDGFTFMIVRFLSEGEKIQRRDFFRFDCVLPMKFSVLSDEPSAADEAPPVFQGVVKDIGGGGICFIANESIEAGNTIKCVIKLDSEVLVVLGSVLHKHVFPKSNYRYQYRVEFIGILKSEQEKIVRFIFTEQKRLLQRQSQ